MEPLKIIEYPDDIVRKRCALVDKITESEIKLFKDMLFTMRHFGGIGLAAPQIGVNKSFIVADIGYGVIQLANPKILKMKGSVRWEEGCLSVPGAIVAIRRPDEIVVSGINEKNKAIELRARGLLARVLQHEIDHLNGRLIIDYLGLLGKIKLLKQSFAYFKQREH